jgi:hypothetical protein
MQPVSTHKKTNNLGISQASTLYSSKELKPPRLKIEVDPKTSLHQLISRQSHNRWFNQSILHPGARIKVLFGILQKFCMTMEQQTETFVLAVHLFDTMISKFPLEKGKMIPIALVASQLATKTNELQGSALSYADLDQHIFSFGVQRFCSVEKMMLNQLDYRVNLVSPYRFLKFLLGEFFKDEYGFFPHSENLKMLKIKFIRLVMNLHLITLVDYQFYKFTSLAVSVSIIILARSFFDLSPWTEQMMEFTEMNEESVSDCVHLLYDRYKSDFVSEIFTELDHEDNQIYDLSQNQNNILNENSLMKKSMEYLLSLTAMSEIIE